MFGKSNTNAAPRPSDNQPHAARIPAVEMAQIVGGGLVQLIVTETYPVQFYLFVNDTIIPDVEVESVSVNIVAPVAPTDSMIVRATLARYVTDAAGHTAVQHSELFPCTLEVIAQGRRIAVSCTRPDSTEGLWVNVGLRPDGDSRELQGLKEFRFLLNHDLVDARITWVDGESESLLPQE
jgi:hypothetical protein